jgi:hypothetical protein
MTATAAFTATVAEAAALLQSLVAGARGLETAFWTAVKADKGSALVSHYHRCESCPLTGLDEVFA